MAYPNDPPAPPTLALKSGESINTGLVAWWPLTDGTGATATDIAGGFDGTQNSTEDWYINSLGTVHRFAGSGSGPNNFFDDCGSTSDFAFAHTTGIITISCWIRPTATGRSFILANNDTSGANGFFFDRNNGNKMHLVVQTSGVGGNTDIETASGTAPSDGTWQHWVVVLDTGSSFAQFYKDGVSVTTTGTIAGTGTGSTKYTTALGGLSSVPSETFDGDLQNVRVWNTALTAQQVSDIYNTPWLGSNYEELVAAGNTFFFPAHFGGRL